MLDVGTVSFTGLLIRWFALCLHTMRLNCLLSLSFFSLYIKKKVYNYLQLALRLITCTFTKL